MHGFQKYSSELNGLTLTKFIIKGLYTVKHERKKHENNIINITRSDAQCTQIIVIMVRPQQSYMSVSAISRNFQKIVSVAYT